MTLNNNNTYTGITQVFDNAILSIPTISDMGQSSPLGLASSGAGFFLGYPNSNPGPYDSRGTLQLTGTSPAYSTNRVVTVSGLYVLGGGVRIDVQNAATNLTLTGQITGSGSMIKTGAGTLLPSNTTNNYSGGTYIEGGRLHVNSDAALGNGSVRILADGILRYTANATVARSIILDGGTLEAPSGISFASGGGVLQGQGMAVGNVANSGSVVPEGSLGLLHIGGDYTQNSSGRLVLFADLFLPPDTNSRLNVTGNAALDGTLQMNLAGMGQFRGIRSFDVLDWSGSLNDTTFSTLQLPMFGGLFTWDTSQLYITGVLTLIGPPLEGDYNNNGIVDAADYVLWRKNNNTATTLPNDLSPGTDDADYLVWRAHFGQSSGNISGARAIQTASAAVPEPTSQLMCLIGVLAIVVRRRAVVSQSHTFFGLAVKPPN